MVLYVLVDRAAISKMHFCSIPPTERALRTDRTKPSVEALCLSYSRFDRQSQGRERDAAQGRRMTITTTTTVKTKTSALFNARARAIRGFQVARQSAGFYPEPSTSLQAATSAAGLKRRSLRAVISTYVVKVYTKSTAADRRRARRKRGSLAVAIFAPARTTRTGERRSILDGELQIYISCFNVSLLCL